MAEEIDKVDGIIESINQLSDAEKRDLTIRVRTTPEGIKAYTSFLYGFGGLPSVPVDNGNTPPIPDEGNPTSKESQDNNNDTSEEEWL